MSNNTNIVEITKGNHYEITNNDDIVQIAYCIKDSQLLYNIRCPHAADNVAHAEHSPYTHVSYKYRFNLFSDYITDSKGNVENSSLFKRIKLIK